MKNLSICSLFVILAFFGNHVNVDADDASDRVVVTIVVDYKAPQSVVSRVTNNTGKVIIVPTKQFVLYEALDGSAEFPPMRHPICPVRVQGYGNAAVIAGGVVTEIPTPQPLPTLTKSDPEFITILNGSAGDVGLGFFGHNCFANVDKSFKVFSSVSWRFQDPAVDRAKVHTSASATIDVMLP